MAKVQWFKRCYRCKVEYDQPRRQSMCVNCRNQSFRDKAAQARRLLGELCKRCGSPAPLVWDHVNDDGQATAAQKTYRRNIAVSERQEFATILRTGQSARLQVLCSSCNQLKAVDRAAFDRSPFAPGITAVMPSIPPRYELRQRALESVYAQTLGVAGVSIAIDGAREGAGPTRTRAMHGVQTEWTAFIDDDDEWRPEHLATLWDAQQATGADVLWPWFDVVGGTDPIPVHEGRQWDPDEPHLFPICALARTRYLRAVAFLPPAEDRGDDFHTWVRVSELGARFHHVEGVRTWRWFHNSGNTSGLPWCW